MGPKMGISKGYHSVQENGLLGKEAPPQKKTSSPLGSHLHGLFLFSQLPFRETQRGIEERVAICSLLCPPGLLLFSWGVGGRGGETPLGKKIVGTAKGRRRVVGRG